MTQLLANGRLMTGLFLVDDHCPSSDSMNSSDVGHYKLLSKQGADNYTGGADVEGNSQTLPIFYDQAGWKSRHGKWGQEPRRKKDITVAARVWIPMFRTFEPVSSLIDIHERVISAQMLFAYCYVYGYI